MRLSDYLIERDIAPADFAKQLGVTAEAVRLWLKGDRWPREIMLRRISEVTDGAVQANDFVGLKEAS